MSEFKKIYLAIKNFAFNKTNKYYSINLNVEYKDLIKFKKKPNYKSNNIKDIHLTII